MAQLDPYAHDASDALAAKAHQGATDGMNDKQVGNRNGVTQRTANNWRNHGRGSPVAQFGMYMVNCPNPWRLVSHVKAIALRHTVEQMSRAELIAEYRRIRTRGIHAEATDTSLDLTPGACWLDRAAASEADAGLDELAAAIERRFAELRPRVTDAEILGGL